MKDYFLRFLIPFMSIIIFLLYGCDIKKSKQQEIVGEWKASWETTADDQIPGSVGDNLKMNGLVNFMEDGKVEISAFGYEGCIFSSDTLKNTLNWKLDDTVLRFMDSGDEHGLPYTINKFTSNELHLTLLQDINLTLLRN
jgi:acylphosphatase